MDPSLTNVPSQSVSSSKRGSVVVRSGDPQQILGVDRNLILTAMLVTASVGLSFYVFGEVKKIKKDIQELKSQATSSELIEKVTENSESIEGIKNKLDQLIEALNTREQDAHKQAQLKHEQLLAQQAREQQHQQLLQQAQQQQLAQQAHLAQQQQVYQAQQQAQVQHAQQQAQHVQQQQVQQQQAQHVQQVQQAQQAQAQQHIQQSQHDGPEIIALM